MPSLSYRPSLNPIVTHRVKRFLPLTSPPIASDNRALPVSRYNKEQSHVGCDVTSAVRCRPSYSSTPSIHDYFDDRGGSGIARRCLDSAQSGSARLRRRQRNRTPFGSSCLLALSVEVQPLTNRGTSCPNRRRLALRPSCIRGLGFSSVSPGISRGSAQYCRDRAVAARGHCYAVARQPKAQTRHSHFERVSQSRRC